MMKSVTDTGGKPYLLLCVLLIFLLTSHAGRANEETYPLRWVYCGVNFQVNDSVDRLIEVMKAAKRIGYNGVVITDYKFGRIKDRSEGYYSSLEWTQQM